MNNDTSLIEKKHKKDRLSTWKMVANREDRTKFFNYILCFLILSLYNWSTTVIRDNSSSKELYRLNCSLYSLPFFFFFFIVKDKMILIEERKIENKTNTIIFLHPYWRWCWSLRRAPAWNHQAYSWALFSLFLLIFCWIERVKTLYWW